MDFDDELAKIGFDDGEVDLEAIYELVDKIKQLPNQRDSIPAIFRFFEKNGDKCVGSPGPLVHFLEEADDYFEELKASISRKPTDHTVWLVNRILNSPNTCNRSEWLDLLKSAIDHPLADAEAKLSAKEFIEYQSR